jgi:hypothetical protein
MFALQEFLQGWIMMAGKLILIIFFLMFTIASLLIPSPMFPGSFFCVSIGSSVSGFALYLSALFNGLVYGVILWLVFVGISRRLEGER